MGTPIIIIFEADNLGERVAGKGSLHGYESRLTFRQASSRGKVCELATGNGKQRSGY